MTKPESSVENRLQELLEVMSRLRDPDTGCRWDLQQTYQSIAPSTVEEAYEVVDAIEREDYQHLREELGDLLFQVVFHSQLAKEEQRFTFDDVIASLAAKLIRRHPHVFPDGSLQSCRSTDIAPDERAVIKSWEAIKQEERDAKGTTGLLDDVPVGLPATTRAAKLQKRASSCGFDWQEVDGVLAQVEEELQELRQAMAVNPHEGEANSKTVDDDIAEEAGDLLFAVVNLTRHLGLDAESVLRQGNKKFERRFRFIETRLAQQGLTPTEADVAHMEDLWQAAKQEGL